jgi:uncharacterized protein (DUF1501 family)
MLTFPGANPTHLCDGFSRRGFLKLGTLCLGGLTLAELLRLKARGAVSKRAGSKAVIYVYLWGGPSHIDTYDMKPDAPAEYRGEFKPIKTNVPGFDICELLPLQAQIADKLALVRNLKFNPNFHDPVELFSGYRKPTEAGMAVRPDFGSVVSKLRGGSGRHDLPAYVALDKKAGYEFRNGPAYLGLAHKAFVPGDKMESLTLTRGVTLERLHERQLLLRTFDQMRRDLDHGQGILDGMDTFTAKALEMITSPRTREAFDVSREPEPLRARYGEGEAVRLLQARRLVEAGVPVVTLTFGGVVPTALCKDNISATSWDTHQNGFPCLRAKLPRLDRAIHALITDLHDRGMEQEVTVIIGGEMGRYPVVGKGGCGASPDGRGHWTQAGFSLISGGGLQMGQVIGRTDKHGERPVGTPYTPQNLLATLYRALGIDLSTTLPDHTGRPMHLLDDCQPIKELM